VRRVAERAEVPPVATSPAGSRPGSAGGGDPHALEEHFGLEEPFDPRTTDLAAIRRQEHDGRYSVDLPATAQRFCLARVEAREVDAEGTKAAHLTAHARILERDVLELAARNAPVRGEVEQHRMPARERGLDRGS